jgi:hypothetical protein
MSLELLTLDDFFTSFDKTEETLSKDLGSGRRDQEEGNE